MDPKNLIANVKSFTSMGVSPDVAMAKATELYNNAVAAEKAAEDKVAAAKSNRRSRLDRIEAALEQRTAAPSSTDLAIVGQIMAASQQRLGQYGGGQAAPAGSSFFSNSTTLGDVLETGWKAATVAKPILECGVSVLTIADILDRWSRRS